jgi:hypothetical protein
VIDELLAMVDTPDPIQAVGRALQIQPGQGTVPKSRTWH